MYIFQTLWTQNFLHLCISMYNLLESTKPEMFKNTIYVITESLVFEYLNTHTEKEFYLHRYLHVYDVKY